jgi:hypothetical protein
VFSGSFVFLIKLREVLAASFPLETLQDCWQDQIVSLRTSNELAVVGDSDQPVIRYRRA